MNVLPTALVTLLAATAPKLAQGQPKLAPDLQPSSDSIELCRELVRGLFNKDVLTSLSVRGGENGMTPRVGTISRMGIYAGEAEAVKCELAGDMSLTDLLTPSALANRKSVRSVRVDEGFSSRFDPIEIRQNDVVQPPYEFVDYKGPDGIADIVCGKEACRPLDNYPFGQQRLLQQRFEQLVRTTLDRYRSPQRAPKTQ